MGEGVHTPSSPIIENNSLLPRKIKKTLRCPSPLLHDLGTLARGLVIVVF
jgi:hypothetical protein